MITIFCVAKKQWSNEKEQEEKQVFPSYKRCFSSLRPYLLLEFINFFSSFVHFKQSKMLWDHQLKLYKSSFSDKGNKTMPKECLVVYLLAFKCSKIFGFNFLTPYFWGTINLAYKRSFLLKKLLKRYRTLDTLHASPFQNKIVI